jgi:hypothetical protein
VHHSEIFDAELLGRHPSGPGLSTGTAILTEKVQILQDVDVFY